MKNKREIAHRVSGFKARMESAKSGGYLLEDVDGGVRSWQELSVEGKLDKIASYATYCDVPFEAFAQAVRDALGDLPSAVREEAALRFAMRNVRELSDLEELLPSDGRIETPAPLIERLQDVLDEKTSLAELKACGERAQSRKAKDRERER